MLNIIADQNIPAAAELFKAFGKVTLVDGRTLNAAQVEQADVLLVRSVTRVDEQLLAHSAVQFVGSATAGFDHLDLAYLQQREVTYALASGANAESVVEYVLAAICSQPHCLERLMGGGKLGVVGYGHVGKRLVEVANYLGIQVGVYDPFVDSGSYANDLDQVLTSDVISLHCELTASGPFPSKHLLNQARLKRLNERQWLLNAARGGVVDNEALLERLEQPNPPTVILDCWENEPAICERLVPKVAIATPHIAGYSFDGKVRGTVMLRDALARHINCCVNEYIFEDDLCIDIDNSSVFSSTLSNLLASVYRIDRDDAQFRLALAKAQPGHNGAWFDALRRDYPIRRELLRAKVAADTCTDGLLTLARCFNLQLIDRS